MNINTDYDKIKDVIVNKDLFKILKVDENCSPSIVRRNFRRLAKLLHPDLNPHIDPQEFYDLVIAYHVLVDPAKRSLYVNRYTKQHHQLKETSTSDHLPHNNPNLNLNATDFNHSFINDSHYSDPIFPSSYDIDHRTQISDRSSSSYMNDQKNVERFLETRQINIFGKSNFDLQVFNDVFNDLKQSDKSTAVVKVEPLVYGQNCFTDLQNRSVESNFNPNEKYNELPEIIATRININEYKNRFNKHELKVTPIANLKSKTTYLKTKRNKLYDNLQYNDQ